MNVRASYRCVCLSLLLGSAAASAQIVTDGTVGPATRLSGPEMTVGAELGSTRGANLFHSFQRFDIPTGHQATFTGPDQIQNVIGRVTGGQTSQIDGTLRSTVGQADVYLINPSGIVMGPNARVDVPAALHLSTADELRFSDGSRYSASDPANSTLTLAAPESFGFLSPQPASLTIAGSQLELKPGKTATLTAGDVSLSGTAERRATLTHRAARSGSRLWAALRLDGAGALIPASITSQASYLSTGHAGHVRVVVAGSVDIAGGATINTGTDGAGRAGTVEFESRALRIEGTGSDYSTGILSQASGASTGDAGEVRMNVTDSIELVHGGIISSGTKGPGGGGTLHVAAGDLRIEGAGTELLTGIATNTESTGHAGQVKVDVAGRIELVDGGVISSVTGHSGEAGRVEVTSDVLRIDGAGSEWFTGITTAATESAWGPVGHIAIQADTLALFDNGAISIKSYSTLSDPAGRTTSGRLRLETGKLFLDGGRISAESVGRVPASDIQIRAEDLRLTNDSRITTSANNANAGLIEIGGGRLWLTDSLITTSANGAIGDGGDITLTPEYLILDGGFIQANTAATGASGGDIRIDTRALIAARGWWRSAGPSARRSPPASGRNIIQAAAPGGEQGTISSPPPTWTSPPP
jgi:filamentous hemagglutinin family protein